MKGLGKILLLILFLCGVLGGGKASAEAPFFARLKSQLGGSAYLKKNPGMNRLTWMRLYFPSTSVAERKGFWTRLYESFSAADKVIFTDTFAAREKTGDDKLIYRLSKDSCDCVFVDEKDLFEEFLRLTNSFDLHAAKKNYGFLIANYLRSTKLRLRETFDSFTKQRTGKPVDLNIHLTSNGKYAQSNFKIFLDKITFTPSNS